MDYLLIEGYKSAAQSFANEASLTPAIDLESIENRMVIRGAVQRGDIETAVGWVNELDPEVSFFLCGALERTIFSTRRIQSKGKKEFERGEKIKWKVKRIRWD